MHDRCLPINHLNRDYYGHPEEYDEERFRQFVRDLTGGRRHTPHCIALCIAEELFDRFPHRRRFED